MCDDVPLAVSYRDLCTIATSKDACVADLWNPEQRRGGWDLNLTRNFNDWEMHLLAPYDIRRVHGVGRIDLLDKSLSI